MRRLIRWLMIGLVIVALIFLATVAEVVLAFIRTTFWWMFP